MSILSWAAMVTVFASVIVIIAAVSIALAIHTIRAIKYIIEG